MNDEIEIPLLDDLIQVGETVDQQSHHDTNQPSDSDYKLPNRSDAEFKAEEPSPLPSEIKDRDELEEVNSIQELLIDEEVRQILDRHMDEAYEEIIRLINHRLKN